MPGGALDHAARLQRGAPAGVDLDEAHAAHADRVHPRVVAEARDVDAVPLGGVDDQLALAGVDLGARRWSTVTPSTVGASAASAVASDIGALPTSARRVDADATRDVARRCAPRTRARNGAMRRGDRATPRRGRAGRSWSARGGQRDGPGEMLSQTSRAGRGRSGRPWPSRMRCRIFSSQVVPSRHGVHLPHDSRAKNRTTRRQALHRRRWSRPSRRWRPEPSIEPALPTVPFSSGRSRCSA